MPDKTPTLEERVDKLEAAVLALETKLAAAAKPEQAEVPAITRGPGVAQHAMFHTGPEATRRINERVQKEKEQAALDSAKKK